MTKNFREYLDSKEPYQLDRIVRGLKIYRMGLEMMEMEDYSLDDTPLDYHIEGIENEIENRRKEENEQKNKNGNTGGNNGD